MCINTAKVFYSSLANNNKYCGTSYTIRNSNQSYFVFTAAKFVVWSYNHLVIHEILHATLIHITIENIVQIMQTPQFLALWSWTAIERQYSTCEWSCQTNRQHSNDLCNVIHFNPNYHSNSRPQRLDQQLSLQQPPTHLMLQPNDSRQLINRELPF
jgi:hypothetical protein